MTDHERWTLCGGGNKVYVPDHEHGQYGVLPWAVHGVRVEAGQTVRATLLDLPCTSPHPYENFLLFQPTLFSPRSSHLSLPPSASCREHSVYTQRTQPRLWATAWRARS